MFRSAILLMCIVGCYSDPDFERTQFKCDDTHSCPTGKLCFEGACLDPLAVPGVQCGPRKCAPDEKCCADFDGPACVGPQAPCDGPSTTCDGIEDCDGAPCCESGQTGSCGTADACPARLCRDNEDCATDPIGRACCFDAADIPPWGRCQTVCS